MSNIFTGLAGFRRLTVCLLACFTGALSSPAGSMPATLPAASPEGAAVVKEKPFDRAIRGKVTSSGDGSGLPGVSILVKGTQVGTTTDAAGNFTVNVSSSGEVVLVLSYIGFETQEVAVGNRNVVDVTLQERAEVLQEAVVTALGIKREERSLGYSVGKVEGKDLTKVINENVLTGLAGRVAGVTINAMGGTGSSVSMVIRGATSLNNDNQPLFVIDGVPIANTLNNVSQIGTDNRVDYGNAISGLNPEDIENISILKGPSAAALYGSRAGNGVVLITTKSGSQVNKMTVQVTSNTVFDKPYRYLNWQTRFGSGQFSAIPVSISNNPFTKPFKTLIEENVGATYGAELDKGYEEVQWNSPIGADGKPVLMPLVSYKNNAKNFLQTGLTTTNGVAISNSTDLVAFRLSYNNMTNRGIIPNTDLFRNTLNLNTSVKINNKLRVSTNLDLSRNNSNNRPGGNTGSNPLEWVYEISPHINVLDMRDYWEPGLEGLQQRSQSRGNFNNPYFLVNEVSNSFVRDRAFGNIKADWQITPSLSLMGRYALDTYKEDRETKIAQSYIQDPRGAYGLINIGSFENNMDVLATYQRELSDFYFSVSAGGNYRYQRGSNFTNATKSGTGLIDPWAYTVQNIPPENLLYNNSRFQRAVYSVYGLMNLSYRNMIFLDVTGRNDWSSTLPADNRSYFYPSASLSVLLSEMIPLPADLSLFKVRGGIAQVGNDAAPYQLVTTLANSGYWDKIPRFSLPGRLLISDLKPEIATSYEVGTDINIFRNRIRLAGTYYMVENRNQILASKLPPSSGYTTKNINAGLLVSKGWEIVVGGTPVQTKDLVWDVNLNFTRNRTRIVELAENIPYYTLWEGAKGGAWTYVGDEIGDIYDAKLVTVEDKNSPYYGYPILDRTGKWQAIDATETKNKIGNFNPRFIMGGQTSLSYKGFTLSMSFDWRNGGQYVSQTYRYGEEHGRSQLFLDKLINPSGLQGKQLRDHLVANAETMIYIKDGNFPLVGGPTNDYGSFPFVYEQYTLPYGGTFIPGVVATGYDDNGNPTGYVENLGEAGTLTLPFAGSTTWSFTSPFMFDASFVKLREISVGYDLPAAWVKKANIQNVNLSVFSRNIMLWTAAKNGIDPETAFQIEAGTQGNSIQFKQGLERYNVTPWVMPIGFKLGLTF